MSIVTIPCNLIVCSSNRTNVAAEFRVFLDLLEEMVEMEEMEQEVRKVKKVRVTKLVLEDQKELWEYKAVKEIWEEKEKRERRLGK